MVRAIRKPLMVKKPAIAVAPDGTPPMPPTCEPTTSRLRISRIMPMTSTN